MAANTIFKSGTCTILKMFRANSSTIIRNLNGPKRFVSNGIPALNKKEIEVTFVQADGERIKGKGHVGDSLLDVVLNNQLALDGFGACEGTLACSTCHVMLAEKDFADLPDEPSAEEDDMLETAPEKCATSRLGCQVILSERLHGVEFRLPRGVLDRRED